MNIEDTLADLRAIFIPHPAYDAITNEIDRIIRRRMAAETSGHIDEAGGLVVLGPSRSGKTTAIRYAIANQPILRRLRADGAKAAVFVRVPAPSSIKDVGAAALNVLGWTAPVPTRWSAMERWRRVQALLQDFQVYLIHFDEAQHLAGDRPKELQAIGDAFKSRLQDPDWPVALAVSATPSFKSVLDQDRQLSGRIAPIMIERMSLAADQPKILLALKRYLNAAKLEPSESIKSHDFARRLMTSGDLFFALTCRMIVDALEEALDQDAKELGLDHFATAFRRFSGSLDAYNPFLADDYEDIDVREILEGRETDDDP